MSGSLRGFSGRYLLLKLGSTILLLWGVATLQFLLVELAPGSPIDVMTDPTRGEAYRVSEIRRLGLDQPLPIRYATTMQSLASLHLGKTKGDIPVTTVIADHLPATLLLSGLSLLLVFPIAITIGTWQAARSGKPDDTALSLVSLAFYSMPVFWLAVMLKPLAPPLGVQSQGMTTNMYDMLSPVGQVLDVGGQLVLPLTALTLSSAAGIARFMRSSMLEVLGQDFIRTARAKGLSERAVLLRHALGNAMLPIITLVGLSLPRLVGGTLLVEVVFAWPGMGQLILQSITKRDTALLLGCFLLYGAFVALGSLLADLGYAWADPRIRHT